MSRWGSFNECFGGPQGGIGNEFNEDESFWGNPQQAPNMMPWFGNPSKSRYNDAYGDYQGGYGPGGGYGPRPFFLPGPPGPQQKPMWGRGFGPKGPPRRAADDDKAIKYLMRCGLTKDHLKNLSHDLLKLITPEYCGLCDMSLDSFPLSRMHYISKNHIKNQKKWMTKTGGAGEVPLKNREMYCELCDIEITSVPHAEAHYKGKPHYAIVDGRKKPKNPLLLQPRMKRRLKQLIRRELRCLEPIPEKDKDAEPPKEPKIITPELYCSICKSASTCSEQMTMHMNGKRHLSKEKQYILKMMRGETKEETKDYEDEDYEEDYEEGEGEEGEGVKGEGDDEEYDKEKDEWGEAEVEPKIEKPDNGEDWGNEAWDETKVLG